MSVVTLTNGKRFEAEAGTSILDAALARGVMLEHGCRTGRCGSCKARVAHGRTAALRAPLALDGDEAARGWVLTCTHEACSDVALEIEDLGALAAVEAKVLPARIDALEPLAPDVLRVALRLPPRSPLRFLAGQHVDVIGPNGVRRSYSIASDAAAGDRLELQVRRVDGGALSAYWFGQARPEDLLRFHGPRGSFHLRPAAGLDLVFLATGTGIAPLLSMLRQVAAMPAEGRPRSVSLYWGGRHPEDHYLDPRGALPGLRYVPVLSRGEPSPGGAPGHVQDALVHDVARGAAPALAGCAAYACGSEAMIHGARRLLADNGLPPARFHYDAFVSSD
jgi:CDP-4-dehydro-6-deoxyglucose reductase